MIRLPSVVVRACAWVALFALSSCTVERDTPRRVVVSRAALSMSVSLDVVGNTYLKSGSPNQNQGSEPILRLRSSGKNRTLLFFDTAAIEAAAAAGVLAVPGDVPSQFPCLETCQANFG